MHLTSDKKASLHQKCMFSKFVQAMFVLFLCKKMHIFSFRFRINVQYMYDGRGVCLYIQYNVYMWIHQTSVLRKKNKVCKWYKCSKGCSQRDQIFCYEKSTCSLCWVVSKKQEK